ncbi:MAG: GAK system CofD-like protein [Pseudomonadota bacterium]
MTSVRVTRTALIPDPYRLNRYQKAPELGPGILFFSGGSALNGVSHVLKNYTHNSTHMVTPFDSGGSSAKLRKAFSMPSIGDLRSRQVALANETVTGHPEVYKLFTYRFPIREKNDRLLRQLEAMHKGKHLLINAISNPMRRLIRNQIGYFLDAKPDAFDLRGASIGNLILAGGYLNNHKHLDPIIFLFSKLLGVQGTVRAIVNDDLHLGADLEDGRRIIGQHLLTGKEVAPLDSPIKRIFLSQDEKKFNPAESEIRKKNRKLIERAELICFPPGSFYTSLIANLLPGGVGSAVAVNEGVKVYIPNLGHDPEQIGMTIDQAALKLVNRLRTDAGSKCPTHKLLNFILMDSKNGRYHSSLSRMLMKEIGVEIIETRLVSKRSAPYYDATLFVEALLSLV